MSLKPGKIKIGGINGRTININFTYKSDDGKIYDGILTVMSTDVGGITTDDYEVIWSDEEPKEYESDKDDEVIYDKFLNMK